MGFSLALFQGYSIQANLLCKAAQCRLRYRHPRREESDILAPISVLPVFPDFSLASICTFEDDGEKLIAHLLQPAPVA